MDEAHPFFRAAAMYLRKSRAEEGEDTQVVLARHKDQLTQFAARQGVHVARIYEEVVSGDSLFARPQMTALLRDVEAGLYTGVLCMDIDRLGRGNMKEQGLILETLKDTGTAILTPDHIYDLNNELDETATEFKTFLARQELKMIKKRLNRGRRVTIEKGGYVANVPFGYARSYRDKIPTLAPEPEEAKAVRLIFRWYLAGEGCPSICRRLNEMGFHPRRGDTFGRTSVRKILRNPVYIGKVVWGRNRQVRPRKAGEKVRAVPQPRENWLVVPGLHPPLLDEQTFRKANELLAQRAHPPCRQPGKLVNPLAGLLFCRRCGRAMALRRYPGRKGQPDEFLCPTPGCMKAARADLVEHDLLQTLDAWLSAVLPPQEESAAPGRQGGPPPLDTALARMRAALRQVTGQRRRICDLLEQGVYSPQEFDERRQLLDEQTARLQSDLRALELERAAARREQDAAPPVRRLLQEYERAAPADRNRLLKSLLRRVFYYKAKDAAPAGFCLEIELRTDEA